MAVDLADLQVNINTNADKSTKELVGLNKSLDRTGKSGGVASKALNAFVKINLAAFALKAGKAIINFGRSFLKAGSDLEETQGKFDVVFEGITGRAEDASARLQKSIGVSEQTAKALLGNTADLLTGLGATSDVALELSIATQQLAGDLASFNNLQGGAAEASERITKALLGEREGLKQLGVVISEERLKELAEQAGIAAEDLDLTTKAALTLQEAYAQSANAIGDFERTLSSSANQTRVFEENIKDIQASLGSVLLPLDALGKFSLNKLLSEVKGITDGFNDFARSAEGAEKIGSAVGKVAGFFALLKAILQPIVDNVLPKLKAVATDLSTAFNEQKGDIEGVSIATKGLALAGQIVSGVLLVVIEIVNQNIATFIRAGNVVSSFAGLFTKAFEVIKGEATISELGNEVKNFGSSIKDYASGVVDGVGSILETTATSIGAVFTQTGELAENASKAFEETSKSVSANVASAFSATNEELKAVIANIDGVDAQVENAGGTAVDTAEKLQEAYKVLASGGDLDASLALLDQANAEALALVGEAGLATEGLEEKFASDRIALLESFLADKDTLEDLSHGEAIDALQQSLDDILGREDLSFEEREALLEAFAEKERDINQKRFEDIAETTKAIGDVAKDGVKLAGSLGDIRSNIANKEIGVLEKQLENEDLTASEREALQNKITAKKKEEALKSFRIDKALNIATATIDTAQAVTKALASSTPPVSYILAGIAGSLGAAQIAAIASQPPPSFFSGTPPGGFTIPPGFENDNFPINVSSGEVVNVDREGGGQPIIIRVDIEGQPIIDTMVRAFNDQEVFISADNILESS